MNVNPSSAQFTAVKPWDSLTPEEIASGDWIELPASPVGGGVKQARRRSLLEKAFPPKSVEEEVRDIRQAMQGMYDRFGA